MVTFCKIQFLSHRFVQQGPVMQQCPLSNSLSRQGSFFVAEGLDNESNVSLYQSVAFAQEEEEEIRRRIEISHAVARSEHD
jgi:hypothetical protein